MKKRRRHPRSGDRYLDLMNFRTSEEAYQKVREWTSNLSDREHTVRSCIFDLQALVEVELRRIYYHLFKQLLFLTSDDVENQKTLAEFDKVIMACTRFRRHRVRCFDGAGGGSWRDGSLPASSSLRLCA